MDDHLKRFYRWAGERHCRCCRLPLGAARRTRYRAAKKAGRRAAQRDIVADLEDLVDSTRVRQRLAAPRPASPAADVFRELGWDD